MKKKKVINKAKVKVVAIFNSWEQKNGNWFFELGQKYPKAYLVNDNGYGWVVVEGRGSQVDIGNAMAEYLKKNPQFIEGQDLTPDDEDFEEYVEFEDEDWDDGYGS